MPNPSSLLTINEEVDPIANFNNPYLQLDPAIQGNHANVEPTPSENIVEPTIFSSKSDEESQSDQKLPPLLVNSQKRLKLDYFDPLDKEYELRKRKPLREMILGNVLPSKPAQKPLLTPTKLEGEMVFKDNDYNTEYMQDESDEYDDFEENPLTDMLSDEKVSKGGKKDVDNSKLHSNIESTNNISENKNDDEKLPSIPIADVDSNPEADEPANEDEDPSHLGLDDVAPPEDEKNDENLPNIPIADVDSNPDADESPNEDEDPSNLGLDDEVPKEDEKIDDTLPNIEIADVDSNPEADEPPNEDEDPSKLGLDDEEPKEDENINETLPNIEIADVDSNPEADEPANEDEDPSKLGLDDEVTKEDETNDETLPNIEIADVDSNPEADERPNEEEDPSKLGLDDEVTKEEVKPHKEITDDLNPNGESQKGTAGTVETERPSHQDETMDAINLEDEPIENLIKPLFINENALKPFLGAFADEMLPDSDTVSLDPDRIVFPDDK
jgi:hypothetical protein